MEIIRYCRFHYIYIALCIFACKSDDIQKYKIPEISSQNTSKKLSSNVSFTWDKPISWIESTGSSMRLASFNIPYSNGYGDLSIIVLSGDGGGIEANINRWRAQLGLEKQDLSKIDASSEYRKNSIGSYQLFEIINNNINDKAFLCAIISQTDNTIFIKLNISKTGINQVKDDFINFCDSFKILNE